MRSRPKQQKTFKQVLLSSAGWSVFTVFVWEIVEEGLEMGIAYLLSNTLAIFIAKTLSTLGIIFATQGVKVGLKRFFMPIFKRLMYKEGNDKMNKFMQFLTWLRANKCTITGAVVGALTAVSGAGVIDVNTLPALMVRGFNLTPVIYYGVLGVLVIVCSFFPETIEKFLARVAEKKAENEQKQLLKEAKKEIKAEEKAQNETQAKNEKEQVKTENEQKAKEEKEKAEAEHRAKIELIKVQLRAEADKKLQEKSKVE